MPIYVFECEHCGANKEVMRSFSAMEEIELCEKCTVTETVGEEVGEVRPSMKRVSFPGKHAFILKGRGWAKDGYK